MPAPALRPRAVTEILDAAFHVFREHFAPLAILAAVALIPFVVVGAIFGLAIGAAAATANGGSAGPSPALTAGLGAAVLLTPIFAAWFLVAQAALQKAFADAYLGEPVSWSGALRHAFSRFWRLIGTAIVKVIVILAPMFAAGILMAVLVATVPALAVVALLGMMVGVTYLFLRFALVPATVVLEENDVGAALRRTWMLTEGHVGRVLGAILLSYLILVALQLTVMGLVTLASNLVVGQIAANLASVVTYPIVAGVVVLLYYDLRIRKEGFDLEVMSADLAKLPEPAPPTPAAAPAPFGARRLR